MKIIISYPPNYKEITAVLTPNPRAIFTYGSSIYNPSGSHVTKDLIAHEEVHERQQNGDPKTWWKRYLSEPQFRLQQETEAYKRQYQYLCSTNTNRNYQFQILQALAMILASPMYGNLTTIEEAMRLIK
jgi:hypothetical protein